MQRGKSEHTQVQITEIEKIDDPKVRNKVGIIKYEESTTCERQYKGLLQG